MSFPDFLKVMHSHSRVEVLPKEIVDAFKAGDPEKRGTVPAAHLKHMLLHWGEQLSPKEGVSIAQSYLYIICFWLGLLKLLARASDWYHLKL